MTKILQYGKGRVDKADIQYTLYMEFGRLTGKAIAYDKGILVTRKGVHIMDIQKLMQEAADCSDTPYPLDENAKEFAESLLRSLDDGVAWAHGKKTMEKNLRGYLQELQRKADQV